jgi:hypothetical protein
MKRSDEFHSLVESDLHLGSTLCAVKEHRRKWPPSSRRDVYSGKNHFSPVADFLNLDFHRWD